MPPHVGKENEEEEVEKGVEEDKAVFRGRRRARARRRQGGAGGSREARGKHRGSWGKRAVFRGSTAFGHSKRLWGNAGKHVGSTGEAGGKLGEAHCFWGKHAFWPFEFLEKAGEAIAPSNLFIILKRMIRVQGDEGYGPLVAWGPLLEFYQLWRGY